MKNAVFQLVGFMTKWINFEWSEVNLRWTDVLESERQKKNSDSLVNSNMQSIPSSLVVTISATPGIGFFTSTYEETALIPL